jgi:hypothetical protein
MIKIFKFFYHIINATIIVALLAIHFVLKEGSFQSSLYFYAFPLPIIILVILFLSMVLSKKWKCFNVIIAAILLIFWLGRSFKIHIPEAINEKDLEVVFWNASRDNGFIEAFKENGSIPDVMVLIESEENNIQELQSKFPNYYFYKSVREIYIFSKTRILIKSEESSKHNSTVINFKTNDMNFFAVDVTGSQDVPRAWELGFVNELITKYPNTIIMGDFNVPFESKNLKKIKTNYNHAFSEKGNGFRETWFWNIPLLSLDHIWVSKDLEILKTQKINTFKSDHCMLKTYIKS